MAFDSRKILPALILCTSLTAFAQFSWAQYQSSGLTAAPFIASDANTLKSLPASTVSTGKRSPFSVSSNLSKAPPGMYNGVVMSAQGDEMPQTPFDLSFDYKGSDKSVCYVDYRPRIGQWARRSLFLFEGKSTESKKDGYKTVRFSAKQFGIEDGSRIRQVAVLPPAEKKAGRFLMDAIYLNDSPVKKAMDTLFFNVSDNNAVGPLGVATPRVAGARVGLGANAVEATQFIIRNSTQYDQVVFLTQGTITTCTPGPTSIPWETKHGYSAPNITLVNANQGYFTLCAGTAVKSKLSPLQMASYNVSFGAAPVNCVGAPPSFPQGVTVAEFTINPYCWTNDYSNAETADISINGGNNAFFEMKLVGTNYKHWITSYVTGTVNNILRLSGGRMANQCQGSNVNNPGIYPYGCTNCTSGPPASPCPSVSTCSTYTTCQINRVSCRTGGTVDIKFYGYDPSTIQPTGGTQYASCTPGTNIQSYLPIISCSQPKSGQFVTASPAPTCP